MEPQRLRPSFKFDEERIEQIKAIVPEAFADSKINWETLHEALGDHLEPEDQSAEHFGLFWPGKRGARRLSTIPSAGSLNLTTGLGINEATTHNIFIEGENLEVLKLIQKSYAGRIKMIYIDPPYNTGNDDFIYKDDYKEPLEAYLKKTGEIDSEGILLTTNSKGDGRFHSKWLDMVYPRLRIANNLLHEEGAIFVSIDDNEIHNLREIMNEIFGEENFLGCIVRATGTTTGQDSRGFGNSFDYLIGYSKSIGYRVGGLALSEQDASRFSEEDDKGKHSMLQLRKTGYGDRREDRPFMYFPVTAPDGTEVYPIGPGGYESRWRVGQTTYKKFQDENLMVWKKKLKDGVEQWIPYVKYYLEGREKRPSPLWNDIDGNKKATIELKEVLGEKVFDNPKPTAFIMRLLQISTEPDTGDIVLDFFAGSGTTPHAVLKQNAEDGGNREYICVQFPEPTHDESIARKAGYSTISEICAERIRRVSKKMQEGKTKGDLGFRAFKLCRSNFKAWQDYHGDDVKQIEMLFDNAESALVDGWTPDSLLTEVMLVQGFPLDGNVNPLPGCKLNHVHLITSTAVTHRLVVCLDGKIEEGTISQVDFEPGDIFICLDNAITDQMKLRLSNNTTLRTI